MFPNKSHPTSVWKKKNKPLDAFSICNPRFQKINAQAVETIPKYNSPPHIVECASCEKWTSPAFTHTKGVKIMRVTKIE